MTTTCRDLVRRALRKLSRIAAGMEPDGDQLDDAMETLQTIHMELVGLGVFGKLYDVVVSDATYAAMPQQNVFCNRVGGVTVTLPTLVQPSWWGLGWGCWDYEFRAWYCGSTPKPPHDGALIRTTDQFSNDSETWVYNAATARWVRLDCLKPTDPAPLGLRYDETIASILAARISPEYGMTTPPQVARDASVGLYALTHRMDGIRAPVYTEYF